MSSTIRFKAPGLVSPTRLGIMDSIAEGRDDDQDGVIQAISKNKAQNLLEIIRSGMLANNKKSTASEQQPFELSEDQKLIASNHYLPISIADELRKLAELKSEEILTEQEFQQIKQELIRKVSRT